MTYSSGGQHCPTSDVQQLFLISSQSFLTSARRKSLPSVLLASVTLGMVSILARAWSQISVREHVSILLNSKEYIVEALVGI